MYTNESQLSAENILKGLKTRFGDGLVVAARPRTAVGNLADLANREITAYMQAVNVDNNAALDSLINFGAVRNSNEINPDGYDYYFGSIVDEISNNVNAHLSFAKNVVAPAVREYAEKVIQSMEHKPLAPESQFNITQYSTPSFLSNSIFYDNVKKHVDISGAYPKPLVSLSTDKFEPKLEWVYRIVQTGDSGLDKEIGDWVSKLCPVFIRHVLQEYFQFTLDIGVVEDTNFNPEHTDKEYLDEALLVYLIANSLFDKEPLQLNTTINQYQSDLAQYKYYTANRINYSVKTLEKEVSDQIVIRSTSRINKSAVVISSIYKDWIKSGGSVEAILGAISLGEQYISVGELNNKKAKYENEWSQFVTFNNSVNTNEYFNFVKNALVNHFYSLYGELSPLEKEYLQVEPNLKDKVFKNVEKYVSELSTLDLKNVYEICKTIVAKIRFYFTSSYDILSEIEQVGIDNPKAGADEASFMAAAKYIARYISDQYTIK